tara:strand:- start:67 stop:495 length:429 start_codon:yes stop_codon:yes gene_type:complete
MSYAVVAAPDDASNRSDGCDCDDDAFLHHLTRPGVHLFTANWCGHCRRMKAALEGHDLTKPYEYYEHEEDEIDFGSLEKTEFDVKGFPTIYFVKKQGHTTVTERYEGGHEGGRLKNNIDEAYGDFLKKKNDGGFPFQDGDVS